MHPVLIELGPLKLHVYGLMIAIAFLVGMNLAAREARRVDTGDKRDLDAFVTDLCFWILVASLVGARLLFIIVNWGGEYSKDPLKIVRFWEGGLVFYGGLIGAILFSIYYSIRKGRNFFIVADTLIPSVPLGQFFGRLGCYAAGCCWGKPVSADFPLGVQFPSGSLAFSSMQRGGELEPGALHTMHIHPVQLYESLGALTIFVVLIVVRPWKRFHGQLVLMYAFLYPILRTSLEFLRGDWERGDHVLGTPLSTGQLISVVVAVVALPVLLVLLKKRGRASSPAQG